MENKELRAKTIECLVNRLRDLEEISKDLKATEVFIGKEIYINGNDYLLHNFFDNNKVVDFNKLNFELIVDIINFINLRIKEILNLKQLARQLIASSSKNEAGYSTDTCQGQVWIGCSVVNNKEKE